MYQDYLRAIVRTSGRHLKHLPWWQHVDTRRGFEMELSRTEQKALVNIFWEIMQGSILTKRVELRRITEKVDKAGM